MLKLLLPAIAIAMIGLTFAWSQLMPEKGKFRLGEASIANVGVRVWLWRTLDTMASTAKITRTKFPLHKRSKKQNDKLIFLEHPKADIFCSRLAISTLEMEYMINRRKK